MSAGAMLRALALLGATAASVAMFVRSLKGPGLEAFVRSNALSLPDRTKLLVTMAVAVAIVTVGACIYAWRRDVKSVQRVSHRLAPLAALGLVAPLCTPAGWADPLTVVLAIGAFVLLAERLLRLSFEVDGPSLSSLIRRIPEAVRRWAPVSFVAAGAAGYAIYMSVQTLWMHGRFQTYGYDLGQYENVFWSTLHGYPLRCSPFGCYENWTELRSHADLATFFFLPFYAIKPGAPALLVIQSCALGLGAIPLYRFAARRIPRGYACVLALVYLLYPPLHGLQFYDFHMQPMASTFILFVIDFVDEKRYWACAIAFVVAIACREDVSVGLAILGVFLLMSGYRPRAGIVMAVVATTYFVLIRFVIMPKFGPGWFQNIYKDLMPEGAKNYGGVIATLLSNPAYVFTTLLTADKLRYALQILVPLAFLPLRRSYLAVSIVHGSLLTLLTTQYPATTDIAFQYSANFIPYIFPAAALALASMADASPSPGRRPAALGAAVIGTLLCGVFWGAIPPRKSIKGGFVTMAMTRPTDADRTRHKDLLELNALIPKDASVAMSEQEMPHISRLNMRTLRDTTDADYFLYGVASQGAANADRLLATGQAKMIAQRPGLKLLRRKDLDPSDPTDLAARAHWKVSSVLAGYEASRSGTHQRWLGNSMFFHTDQESSPWIEFDLGEVTTVSSFVVGNRLDCCRERAVPLVVEVSTDGASFTEVARREAQFDTWKESIAPRPARFVRFRVARPTFLHLASVEIR
jgi:uncharacterized membrane protein